MPWPDLYKPKEEDLVDRFEDGLYSRIYIAPLNGVALDPDLFIIYGGSAQIMKLIQGASQSSSFFYFQAIFPPSYPERMKIWEEEGKL